MKIYKAQVKISKYATNSLTSFPADGLAIYQSFCFVLQYSCKNDYFIITSACLQSSYNSFCCFRTAGKKDPGVPNKCPFKDEILEEAGRVKAKVSIFKSMYFKL